MTHRIGVCSWSLQAESPAAQVRRVVEAGVPGVQLALEPLRGGGWTLAETRDALAVAGIGIWSGMMQTRDEDYSTLASIRETGGVRSDEHWAANLAAAQQNARLARDLGIRLITLHAGFLPHEPRDPLRRVMVQRLREMVDRFADQGARVAFETGQETAETMLDVLQELDRPLAGVNFDPANMILYGVGDPIEALRKLAPHVVQIHVKDAVATRTPGTWGDEVPVGMGDVDWPVFFDVLHTQRIRCDLMIEREAGDDRVGDICRARQFVERYQNERR